MRYVLWLVVVTGLLVSACGVWAMDFMTMPLADQLPGGGFRAGYYLMDVTDTVGGPTRVNLYETAYGFGQSVEISYLTLRPDVGESSKAFNISYQMQAETTESWATTVGAYNVLSSDYRGSAQPAWFVVAAKTVDVGGAGSGAPRGGPIYRAVVGYGMKSHEGWFYGVQAIMDARLSGMAARYAGQSLYGLNYALQEKEGSPMVHAGTVDGDPFYGISISRVY